MKKLICCVWLLAAACASVEFEPTALDDIQPTAGGSGDTEAAPVARGEAAALPAAKRSGIVEPDPTANAEKAEKFAGPETAEAEREPGPEKVITPGTQRTEVPERLRELEKERIPEIVIPQPGHRPGLTRDEIKETEQRLLLQNAREAFGNKEYARARAFAKDAYKTLPETEMAEEALYLQAESAFFENDLFDAYTYYEKLFEEFGDSLYVPQCLPRLKEVGRRYLGHYDSQKGVYVPGETRRFLLFFNVSAEGTGEAAYLKLLERAQFAKEADDILMRLGEYYLWGDTDYESAAVYFIQIREKYPDSEWFEKATYYLALCYWNLYGGPGYGDKIADEARNLFAEYLERYPSGHFAGKARAGVKAVDTARARAHLRVADFYRNRDKAQSARIYYEKIVGEYPTSDVAKTAKARLAQIRPLDGSGAEAAGIEIDDLLHGEGEKAAPPDEKLVENEPADTEAVAPVVVGDGERKPGKVSPEDPFGGDEAEAPGFTLDEIKKKREEKRAKEEEEKRRVIEKVLRDGKNEDNKDK